MAQDDKATYDEESNVEEINKFVSSSEPQDSKENVVEHEETSAKHVETLEEEKKPHREHVQAKKPAKAEPKKIEPKTVPVHKAAKASVAKKLFSKNKKAQMRSVEDPKPRKAHKADEHSSKKKNKNLLLWIGIGALAVILIVALVLILLPNKDHAGADNQTTNTVAATVNGEPIYLADVQKQYASLNPVLQQMYTIETLLNKSIDDMLLYQEAKRLDIKIPDTIIDNEIESIRTENKMTQAQFEAALAKQGMTLDQAKEVIRKSLSIRQMLNETILQGIQISDTDIENYYSLNKDEFKVPDQVTVRHILILVTDNVTNETAKAKIESIKAQLNDTNFCELAQKYSEDPGSRSNCGEYTFGKGDFNNPEFENPSFDLKVGESAIVQTSFGYHLIKKMAFIPAHTKNLTEVSESINKTLYDEAAQAKFDALLAKLRSEAVIVNYYTKQQSGDNQTNTTETSLDAFAQCLTEKNATLYGAYWCPHCEKQKEMFGDSLKYINYVECAVEGQPQVQTKACTDAKISGYPTWIINGEQYPGEQTLDKLSALTGCSR